MSTLASEAPAKEANKKSAAKTFEAAIKTDKNGKPIRSFVSIGEKIHNEITYRGVDWLLNSAFGVAFAYTTSRTEFGRKIWSRPLNKFFTGIFEPLVKAASGSKAALEKSVGYGVMFLSIMFGGTITIPPLMALENPKNKVPFIKRLDTWIYGKDKVENDPKFAQSYEEIKHEPKKDFWTGMKTRGIALAPLLAFTLYEPSHLFVKKHFYDHISRGTKYVAEKMGMGKSAYWSKKSVEGIEKKTVAEAEKISSNWQELHDTIAFDFGLTILYSFLHEAAYKLFAQKKDRKRNAKESAKHEKPIAVAKEEREAAELPVEKDLVETLSSKIPVSKISHIADREMMAAQQQAATQLT